jgi:hypothetical protein
MRVRVCGREQDGSDDRQSEFGRLLVRGLQGFARHRKKFLNGTISRGLKGYWRTGQQKFGL